VSSPGPGWRREDAMVRGVVTTTVFSHARGIFPRPHLALPPGLTLQSRNTAARIGAQAQCQAIEERWNPWNNTNSRRK
jgi:hypothetical protein